MGRTRIFYAVAITTAIFNRWVFTLLHNRIAKAKSLVRTRNATSLVTEKHKGLNMLHDEQVIVYLFLSRIAYFREKLAP